MRKIITIGLIALILASMFCGCAKKQEKHNYICSFCKVEIGSDKYEVYKDGTYYRVCKDCYEEDKTAISFSDYIIIEESGYDGSGSVNFEYVSPKIVFDALDLSLEEYNEFLWKVIEANLDDEVLVDFLKEKEYDFSEVEKALEAINVFPDEISGCSNGANCEFTVTGYETFEELFDVKFKDTTFTYEVTKLKPAPMNVDLTVDIASAPSYLGPESIELEFMNLETEETYQITLFNHNRYKNTIEIETGEYEIIRFYMGEAYEDNFELDITEFTVDQRHTNYLHLNISETD